VRQGKLLLVTIRVLKVLRDTLDMRLFDDTSITKSTIDLALDLGSAPRCEE
jgi:hypothetical protein